MISPHLTDALAHSKVDDLHRAAAARARRPQPTVVATSAVTLRFGSPTDQQRLARLAELDSATPPALPVLLAEVDGQLLAALALPDGRVIADPFHSTAGLIDLLRSRARQLGTPLVLTRSGRLRSWARMRALAWR